MHGTVSLINGISLWHTMQGKGVPFVLLHGGPGAYDYLEPLAELLFNRYQVIRYDQRGSWRSEKKGPYDIETFIDDLEHVRIHFGFDHWIVGGHSWGASLALAYTKKYHSRVRALIYMSGTGIHPAWHDDYRVNRLNKMTIEDREEYIYLRSVVGTLQDETKTHAWERIRELSLRTDLYHQDKYAMLPRTDGLFFNEEVNRKLGSSSSKYLENEAFEKAISCIPSPSLFIHGEVDPRPYTYVKELANRLQSGECRVIPNAGHYPWLDNPTVLKKQIIEFLAAHNI